MALKKREFTPESGTVDTYESDSVFVGNLVFADSGKCWYIELLRVTLIISHLRSTTE